MVLMPKGGRSGMVERLKYHLGAGKLKLAARGVYAVVPPGLTAERFQPDPVLVASAVRPDGIFSLHSALELLGAAHSMWRQCTLYVEQRRRPLRLNGTTIRFLEHLAQNRPRSPHYLERNRRGGALAARWNLILPEVLVRLGEPDER